MNRYIMSPKECTSQCNTQPVPSLDEVRERGWHYEDYLAKNTKLQTITLKNQIEPYCAS